MNKLTRDDLLTLLKIVIAIALVVIAVNFFIKILPLVIIVLIILLVYDSLKRNNNLPWKNKKRKSNVVEAEIINEKKNK